MQNNFIYTFVLISIGLVILTIIYYDYLESSPSSDAIEGFQMEGRPSEAEMAEIEEREVLDIPNTMAEMYDDPYETADDIVGIKEDATGGQVSILTDDIDDVLYLDNGVDEGFKNQENTSLFTKFFNWLSGKKVKSNIKEGFNWGHYNPGYTTKNVSFIGADGASYTVQVQEPNAPAAQPSAPHHHRRGRRNRRHRRRRSRAGGWFYRSHNSAWQNYLNNYNQWAHNVNTYHGHRGGGNWRDRFANAKQAAINAKNKEIEAEMERKRRAAVVKKLTDKHEVTKKHIDTVKGKLKDYRNVKQDPDTLNKVVKEAGTRIYAAVDSRLVDEGKGNASWETDLTGYHRTKKPTYTDQFEWNSTSADPTLYIANQKAQRLRENKIAENIGTRNANWPTIESDMNNLLKPYYADNKVPAGVIAQITGAYGMASDPYTWTLTKHKNAATDKMYEIKKGKDQERTNTLIRLKNEAVARRKAADDARLSAQVEMNTVKQNAITMNKARKEEMEKLAKAMASRAKINNDLVKDMTNTMDKRHLSNVSSQKDMMEWEAAPFRLAFNATARNISDATRALNDELDKQRGTRSYLNDARMDNIREISLRARQNYDAKLNARLNNQ